MIIDVHGHMVPSDLLEDAAWEISLEGDEETGFKMHARGLVVGPVYRNLIDPETQIAEMDETGIDQRVISVPPFLFGYNRKPGWTLEWCRAYNNTLADICLRYPDRFLGLGAVPLQDPTAATVEMERCITQLKLAGIEIGTHVGDMDLDDVAFSGFFAGADSLGCNMLIHPNNVVGRERLSKYYLSNLVGNPFETTIAASRLMLSGFFESHPNVSLCFSHGGGAFPFLLGRIRHGMTLRPEIPASANQGHVPKTMYFDTVVHDAATLDFLIRQCGLDNIMLGSDYPFDMGDANPAKFIMQAVSSEATKAIWEDNPLRFLNR